MSPPRKKTKEDKLMRPQPDGVIRLEVKEISNLSVDDDSKRSPEVIVKGVPCTLFVWRDTDDLCAQFYPWINQKTPWSIDVKTEYIIVHPDSTRNVSLEEENTIGKKNNHAIASLMNWEDIVSSEKGFVKDDNITIEVRVWISNMRGIKMLPHFDFTDPND
ncbi:hypothetical protein PMAYCL1PPCAC_25321, partial [Pristionchus mayeri]